MPNNNLTLIFTTEDRKVARKGIANFRQSYIIDCRDMVLSFDYATSVEVASAQDFIVNREIEKKMSQAINNKKSTQVIYFNYDITTDLVLNVKGFFADKGVKVDYMLFDPDGKYSKDIRRLVSSVLK